MFASVNCCYNHCSTDVVRIYLWATMQPESLGVFNKYAQPTANLTITPEAQQACGLHPDDPHIASAALVL